MKKIAAVIVTYNRKKLLKECIERLIDLKENALHIYIIDNNSTDGTYEFIKDKIDNKNVYYYNTTKNLGGAGGFNFGMKKIVGLDYDYCWIMDDDTFVQKETLSKLLEKAKLIKDDFSFLSSVVLWKNNELCKMNIPAVSSTAIENYKMINKGLLKIDSASFVSCFVNMKYVKKVGLPITDFFIYGDDYEYTLRLSLENNGYLVPDSIVEHMMNSNLGINIVDVEYSRIDRLVYNYRNLNYIYKKYNIREYKMLKIKSVYLIFKILFKSKDHKFKRIKAIIIGMHKGRKFNPTIEYK